MTTDARRAQKREATARYNLTPKGEASRARAKVSSAKRSNTAARELSGQGPADRRRWADRNKATRVRLQQQWFRNSPKGRATYRRGQQNKAARIAKQRALVDAIKVERGCVDCGYNSHPRALDFDHLGDDKTDGVSRLVSLLRPIDEILAEIAKCEVVCANCHRIRTHERLQYTKDVSRSSTTVDTDVQLTLGGVA